LSHARNRELCTPLTSQTGCTSRFVMISISVFRKVSSASRRGCYLREHLPWSVPCVLAAYLLRTATTADSRTVFCKIWGSQAMNVKCCSLPVCGVFWSGRSLPTFLRSIGLRRCADKSLFFPISYFPACSTTKIIFLGRVKEVRTTKS
jgi:hypothetical protein